MANNLANPILIYSYSATMPVAGLLLNVNDRQAMMMADLEERIRNLETEAWDTAVTNEFGPMSPYWAMQKPLNSLTIRMETASWVGHSANKQNTARDDIADDI